MHAKPDDVLEKVENLNIEKLVLPSTKLNIENISLCSN
jgi:hypothetical protein